MNISTLYSDESLQRFVTTYKETKVGQNARAELVRREHVRSQRATAKLGIDALSIPLHERARSKPSPAYQAQSIGLREARFAAQLAGGWHKLHPSLAY